MPLLVDAMQRASGINKKEKKKLIDHSTERLAAQSDREREAMGGHTEGKLERSKVDLNWKYHSR